MTTIEVKNDYMLGRQNENILYYKCMELEQENKQLKDKINNYKQENKELKANKNLNHVQKKEFEKLIFTNNRLIHSDEILTELEEWLNRERNDDSEYSSYERFTAFDETLDKIQELKEKYKIESEVN